MFKAKDEGVDGRVVAVRVLSPDFFWQTPKLRERFEEEAQIIASLGHPNICAVSDIGQQGAIDFLVSEYVEGQTLAQSLREGLSPLNVGLRHAIEIADALDAIHRQNLTHGDLKPANVMLSKGSAKLMDFGLARIVDQWPYGELPAYAALSLHRSIGYLPRIGGDRSDCRNDIYAFGTVIYEMVTGKRAFGGENVDGVMRAMMEHNPPLPSSLQPLIPIKLDQLIMKCLAEAPDKRWQSAKELCSELKRIFIEINPA